MMLEMVIDVWMQHPTLRFLGHEMFASLRRWTGAVAPAEQPDIAATVGAMDASGVDFGLLSAWTAPHQRPLISNEQVAGWIAEYPSRFGGVAAVDLNKPMQAVRELHRCIEQLGFKGLRVVPWLWEAAPTDRR
jgi:predicted TIM-barrel fold metal-dependent hydrolase